MNGFIVFVSVCVWAASLPPGVSTVCVFMWRVHSADMTCAGCTLTDPGGA